MSMAKREFLKKEIQELEDQGIIKPSRSPWTSPVVLVKKPDLSYRLCIDFRRVNAVSILDAYPLPRIDEILEMLGRARYISTIDLAKGYWQIPLEEKSKAVTAFTTPFGLYEFNVLPFGLHSAPATFQRLMNEVL